ncbi:unnamed protein product [Adineta steineri]|uniref:5'-3' exoribonuclease 1 n=1 Tax=Adineta steineri TaxID=433720 RepID=A0A813PER5_9BILA|nr:unnamed protein product [Adineta steineri]CAF0862740.1 unnamed protein product [Adineta steineri]
MGVPKFFRWISERYPNISRVINDNQIPDFDNFYLDMNGIIHACSHLNEDSCEVNVTEEEIFRNIFHYIDFLFRLIKPKKVFFMAIDGVAPRAKMNQQRARRFRAGQDRIRKLKKIAEKSGQSLKSLIDNHFDTNSITPGTQFMANLHEQLKYFVHVKLTTDPLWEGVDVHLSGHLTPGEGEHKIMDYIRYTRLQPGYDVNTKHCLYGLDADLIMLGLVTHEIHFALLREEVKYGSKKASKILTPEEINWHLFHTCLLRNYIDLEFRSMKEKLKFTYDLECIIDDWILMAYLVGNDFIPHLPRVHINEEALSILWETYKTVLPTLDGYLNEFGELNLPRFEIYLTELAKLDHQRYADENDTFKNLNKATGRKTNPMEKESPLDQDDDIGGGFNFAALDQLNSKEPPSTISGDKYPVQKPSFNERKSPELSSVSDDDDESSDSDSSSDNQKKRKSKTINDNDIDKMPLIEAEFRQHKNHYYREKMKINITSTDQLKIYIEQYIEALQWILKYYYQGCPSWSWFYPHHYAPYLSDLKNFKDLKINLQKGTPFKPFEQLLSVLPPTSRDLLPSVLQSLMVDPKSPLLDFYPEYFELDQNEKKHDWEALVLLPFIDEQLLLDSITKYYNQLDLNEQNRNQELPSLCYRTTEKLRATENSLGKNLHFPPLKETRAICTEIPADQYRPDGLYFKHNHCQEKDMIIFPKFPSLNVLPYKYAYKASAVSLFETRSKATTLILNLIPQSDSDCITYNPQWNPKGENALPPFQITHKKPLIERYLGKRVFVDWPHFQYGIVCAISDFQYFYTWTDIPGGSYFYSEPVNNGENQDYKNYVQTPIYVSETPFEVLTDHKQPAQYNYRPLNEVHIQMEYTKALNINRKYENQRGISIGPIPILLYVSPLIGYRTKCSSTSDKCRTAMCFSNQALAYPLQTTLFTLPNYKNDLDRMPQTIYDHFKINDHIFALRSPYYASSGYVQQINKDNNNKKHTISCQMESSDTGNQPDIHTLIPKLHEHQLQYYTAQQIADRLKTSSCVVSKVTGKINVFSSNKRQRRAIPTNVGLSWKVNKPVKQLHGYTKKIDQVWYYSDAAMAIINDYMLKFPNIIEELTQKPRDDNYYEANIWPDKNPKHEIIQLRTWIKSLPTHSIPLTDGAWEILDLPVINEIEKSIKSFYTKRAEKKPVEKTKVFSFEPDRLFKASEFLGMCDPDIGTTFQLYDRVVNVRLGTGVPIGTRGTIIGIMHGQTNLDTYYEILFDNLPINSLEAILLGKNQQKCRIKVHSYHLLNYSHSLRVRSNNYQHQRSVPMVNTREQQTPMNRQEQSSRVFRKQPDDKNTKPTKPKSAPASNTYEKPNFAEAKQTTPITNNSSSSPPTTIEQSVQSMNIIEDSSLFPALVENLPDQEIMSTQMNLNIPSTGDPLFLRAIQDSEQLQYASHQSSTAVPQMDFQHVPPMFPQQTSHIDLSQYHQSSFPTDGVQYWPQQSQDPFNQQSSIYTQQLYQQPMPDPFFQSVDQSFNPMMYDPSNGLPLYSPYNLPPETAFSGYPGEPMGGYFPLNNEQHPFPMQTQNIPAESHNTTATSHMQPQSSPLQNQQQTTSPNVTNRATLQFIPIQVLRNIPKKS